MAKSAFGRTAKGAFAGLRLRDYKPIEMPRNSPTGFITAFFATMTGFALIWHIWWLVGVGIVAAYAVFVWFAWRDVEEYLIPAEQVARIDRAGRQARANWLATNNRKEGLALHAQDGGPQ